MVALVEVMGPVLSISLRKKYEPVYRIAIWGLDAVMYGGRLLLFSSIRVTGRGEEENQQRSISFLAAGVGFSIRVFSCCRLDTRSIRGMDWLLCFSL